MGDISFCFYLSLCFFSLTLCPFSAPNQAMCVLFPNQGMMRPCVFSAIKGLCSQCDLYFQRATKTVKSYMNWLRICWASKSYCLILNVSKECESMDL